MTDHQPPDRSPSHDPTPASRHGSQQLEAHREWIAGRVLTLLENYWIGDRQPYLEAAVAADWIAILEKFPPDAVKHACRSYLAEERRRPVPVDIRERAIAYLNATRPKPDPKPFPWQLPPPERKVIDAETAQRMVHDAGYTERKTNLVRRFPSAPSMDAIERIAEAPPSRHWTDTADPDGPEMSALRAARDANPLIQAARAVQAASQAERQQPDTAA